MSETKYIISIITRFENIEKINSFVNKLMMGTNILPNPNLFNDFVICPEDEEIDFNLIERSQLTGKPIHKYHCKVTYHTRYLDDMCLEIILSEDNTELDFSYNNYKTIYNIVEYNFHCIDPCLQMDLVAYSWYTGGDRP